MQNVKQLCVLFARRVTVTRKVSCNKSLCTVSNNLVVKHNSQVQTFNNIIYQQSKTQRFFYHNDSFTDIEEDEYTIYPDQPKSVKNLLYANSDDPLLKLLNGCVSIKQVFQFLTKYDKIIQPMHLAQAVLVLWDLHQVFQHVTEMTSLDKVEKLMKEYTNELITRSEFRMFMDSVEENVEEYNAEELSCIYIHLKQIGIMKDASVMKRLFSKLCKLIPGVENLAILAMFMTSMTNQHYEEAYEVCKGRMPIVLNKLDSCSDTTDFKHISMCFNALHREVSNATLLKYQQKVENMINSKQLTIENTDTIIKVILFLHYPQWRHKHSELLSKCVILMKPKISQLGLYETLILNEVFLKTQEPASVFFELQRHTAKLLRELEEMDSTAYQKRLYLVNSLLHSTPSERPSFEAIIRKYFSYPLNGICLLQILKSLQYLKILDPIFCKSFWDKLLIELEHDEEFKREYMLKVCYLYMIYNQNLPYRHFKLEKRLNQWLEGLIETSKLLEEPKCFIIAASFLISYGNDVAIINYMANMYRDHQNKFTPLECTSIAKGLNIGRNITKNVHLKDRYFKIFSDVSDKINCDLLEKYQKDEVNSKKCLIDVNLTNEMLKSYVFRNKLEHPMVDKLLLTYKDDTYLSSKQIRMLTMCLMTTSALLPGVIDRMVEYVCRCKENILAFNAEKVAYLCYHLGYIPKKSEMFAKTLTDLILRDQEKINGLCYLQSCLALCFFNHITSSLIKQIFNVRFMEKLDLELKNCYAKDVYPNRVRHRMMELNRNVCIDYPELNIPWFHQKFVQQNKNADLADSNLHSNVELYLNKIFFDCDIETNVLMPYGYNVDFTIEYKDDDDKLIKLGMILTRPKHYTRINKQLKGALQTKIRHIEMMGYKVKVLSHLDWTALVYGEDKINYIRNLLDLPSRYPRFYYQINR